MHAPIDKSPRLSTDARHRCQGGMSNAERRHVDRDTTPILPSCSLQLLAAAFELVRAAREHALRLGMYLPALQQHALLRLS